MSPLILYDRIGTPMAYIDDGNHIFYFNGETIAYIDDISIYNYEGKHLGFFRNGWIRDNAGKCVLFTKAAIGGPEKRIQDIYPVKSQKSNIPYKKPIKNKKIKLIIKEEWSELAVKEFFNQ
ncbi:MAG: 4-fold beta flower protein [Candidatus Thorarchaeota archaeon]